MLALLVLIGGFFRFYNLNWDAKHSFHPDERNILGQTAGIQSGNGYKVSFFAYGQLPVYLYRATAELISTPQFLFEFFHGKQNLSLGVYWFLLLILFGGILWFFPREKWKIPVFGTSSALFVLALFFNFAGEKPHDVFNSWFSALEGQKFALNFFSLLRIPSKDIYILPIVSFIIVAIASIIVSVLVSKILEIEWLGLPLYIACGITFISGLIPGLLGLISESFSQFHLPVVIASLAFTLLVAVMACWLAWVSRAGRALLALLAVWAFIASRQHAGLTYTGYGEIMIVGRWWSALFSTLTIPAVYLLANRIYRNTTLALIASAAMAFAVVSIEQAHYCITESFITLMMVVVAFFSFSIIQNGSWKNYLLTGAAFGLSMAAKTSSLYYLFTIVAAHLVSLAQVPSNEWERKDRKERENKSVYSALAVLLMVLTLGSFLGTGYQFQNVIHDLFSMNPKLAFGLWLVFFFVMSSIGLLLTFWEGMKFSVIRGQMPQWIKLGAAGGLSFLIFCLLSPWSLLDYSGFMGSQQYEWHVVSISDACYVIQFKDTPRYLYQLLNLMHVELWWPLGITVVLGMFWVLGRFLFQLFRPVQSGYLLPLPFVRKLGWRFSLPDFLILAWFIPYFGFIGSWNTKFIRYMVPLIPAFCIFGARFLNDIFSRIKPDFQVGSYLKRALLTVILGSSLFYSIAYMHVYIFPHPWIEASVWIFNHVPQGSTIATDAWDDGLPQGVDHETDSRVEGSKGPQNYSHVDITPYEMHGSPTDDTQIKKNYYANVLQKPDYISLACKKLWYSLTDCTPEFRPHGYNVYPVTSRYYRLLWSGLLGFKMVEEAHNFPKFLGWEHPDDMAEESFSVYDHPRVYFFKKFETVPPERILKLLDSDDYVKGINRDIMRTITPDNVDDFIAKRHKYLEEKGLLKQLDQAAPVTAAQEKTPKKATKQEEISKPKKVTAKATPITESSEEIKVEAPSTVPALPDPKTLKVLESYAQHPVTVTDLASQPPAKESGALYQLWAWFSWLALLIVLGWIALPLTLRIMTPIASGAYSLSKVFGFFIFAWVVWFFSSLNGWLFPSIKLCRFTMGSCWFWLLFLAILSAYFFRRDQKTIRALYVKWGRFLAYPRGSFCTCFFGLYNC